MRIIHCEVSIGVKQMNRHWFDREETDIECISKAAQAMFTAPRPRDPDTVFVDAREIGITLAGSFLTARSGQRMSLQGPYRS